MTVQKKRDMFDVAKIVISTLLTIIAALMMKAFSEFADEQKLTNVRLYKLEERQAIMEWRLSQPDGRFFSGTPGGMRIPEGGQR